MKKPECPGHHLFLDLQKGRLIEAHDKMNSSRSKLRGNSEYRSQESGEGMLIMVPGFLRPNVAVQAQLLRSKLRRI